MTWLPLVIFFILAFNLKDFAFSETELVTIQGAHTWIYAANECYQRFGGHLVGNRNPILQDLDLSSCTNGSQVWTGTYKSSQPNLTPWLTFTGCHNASILNISSRTPLEVTRVYDCFYICNVTFALTKHFCLCLGGKTLNANEQEIDISNCEIDLDGNLHGTSDQSAAIYEKVNLTLGLSVMAQCATINSGGCNFSVYNEKDSCFTGTNYPFSCKTGGTVKSNGTSWMEAQQYCMSHGSYLHPFKYKCSSCTNKLSAIRRYQQIQDLNSNTTYQPKEISLCQTVQFPNIGRYRSCNDSTQQFAGLCAIQNSVTNRYPLIVGFQGQRNVIFRSHYKPCSKKLVMKITLQTSVAELKTDKMTNYAISTSVRCNETTTELTTQQSSVLTESNGQEGISHSVVTTDMTEMENQLSSEEGKDNTGLTVGITVPVIIILASSVVAFFICRWRKNKKGTTDNATTLTHRENNLYMISSKTSTSRNELQREIPLKKSSTTETLNKDQDYQKSTVSSVCIEKSTLSNDNNYHILEKMSIKNENRLSDDVYYISEEPVYDELNKQRQKRGVQQNEYGTVCDDVNDHDVYGYDDTKNPRYAKTTCEDYYHTANYNRKTDDGNYDVSQRSKLEEVTPYDTF